ncbi:GntR family transcriptional regulator [Streptomyces sp. 7N604]|uniref:GntR family transcriptional regulator n=1 Tax=Streptomyces sp. 7N604 TaxID=3457415 RepID=UPI003FD0F1CB
MKIGTFEPGQQLPSDRQLCKRFGIADMTVRNALEVLRREGFVHTVQGVGSFVTHPAQILSGHPAAQDLRELVRIWPSRSTRCRGGYPNSNANWAGRRRPRRRPEARTCPCTKGVRARPRAKDGPVGERLGCTPQARLRTARGGRVPHRTGRPGCVHRWAAGPTAGGHTARLDLSHPSDPDETGQQ